MQRALAQGDQGDDTVVELPCDAGWTNIIGSIGYSYSFPPHGGRLLVKDSDDKVYFDLDIGGAGPDILADPIQIDVGKPVTVTLEGVNPCVGKLVVTYDYFE